jgi:hypothetical protein
MPKLHALGYVGGFLMGLKDNKLFAVDMPKGSFCDCGKQAETQFVITNSKGEAKRLATEAKKARALGSKAPDVVCGLCVANLIAAKGLFVSEVLKYSPIKLDRVTFDTECLDCGKPLPFGTYAHFHAESGQSICIECGVKRGWTDKARATSTVRLLELKEDIKALRKRYKIEAEGLYLLEEKVDLHLVAENYIELERQITATISKLESYLNSVATPEEKTILKSLEKEIHGLQDLALEIKKEFESRLFLLDRAERQRKMVQKIFESIDAESEEEAARNAEQAQAEVPAE